MICTLSSLRNANAKRDFSIFVNEYNSHALNKTLNAMPSRCHKISCHCEILINWYPGDFTCFRKEKTEKSSTFRWNGTGSYTTCIYQSVYVCVCVMQYFSLVSVKVKTKTLVHFLLKALSKNRRTNNTRCTVFLDSLGDLCLIIVNSCRQ